MGQYIKYQRFVKEFTTEEQIQPFLDELIAGGWEIISYQEEKKSQTITLPTEQPTMVEVTTTIQIIAVTIMAGRTSSVIKNVL
jgi:hypothetical protein